MIAGYVMTLMVWKLLASDEVFFHSGVPQALRRRSGERLFSDGTAPSLRVRVSNQREVTAESIS